MQEGWGILYMIKKIGIDFNSSAIKKQISGWNTAKCGLCDYYFGFVFSGNHEEVGYDVGCECLGYQCIQISSWDHIADYYNRQKKKKYIKEMNEFWGFND
jgi:hypothetical protein